MESQVQMPWCVCTSEHRMAQSRCPVSTALRVVGCENEASTAEDSGKATL